MFLLLLKYDKLKTSLKDTNNNLELDKTGVNLNLHDSNSETTFMNIGLKTALETLFRYFFNDKIENNYSLRDRLQSLVSLTKNLIVNYNNLKKNYTNATKMIQLYKFKLLNQKPNPSQSEASKINYLTPNYNFNLKNPKIISKSIEYVKTNDFNFCKNSKNPLFFSSINLNVPIRLLFHKNFCFHKTN